MMTAPKRFTRVEDAVAFVRERLGKHWNAAAPLGLGKPNRLINALYLAAKADSSVQMTLMTALSLARPNPAGDLEKRFLGPFARRWWGDDYPDLEYLKDVRANRVPANIEIREFYLQSGSMLGRPAAQRNYVSVNYTHVARDVAATGVNLALQLVARRDTPQGPRYSLSCNTDTTMDLRDRLRAQGRNITIIGVVHCELPFVGNDAEVGEDFFDAILESPDEAHRLFGLPRQPVEPAEYMLGLHASALVKDGGTLQIGIGALSDAIVYGLKLRCSDNASYRNTLEPMLDAGTRLLVQSVGGLEPLQAGLYGASEMVMDGFMELHQAGILKRRVYDYLPLQNLHNRRQIGNVLRADDIDMLVESGVYPRPLTEDAVQTLIGFGLLPAGSVMADRDHLRLPDGTLVDALLPEGAARDAVAAAIDGVRLANGRYLHGAFFLGSHALYDWIRGLKGEDFEGFCMTRVSHINELYGGQEALQLAQRHEARFFNTCMMHTVLGAAVSDALENGQVVSGVGGQYNFVAMAHAVPTGRSVLMLRATRESGGEVQSNILWNYGYTTIPRHLRDLVVTEYGVADLRGQSDEECIKRMIGIADARFQDELAARARSAGKLDTAWSIPERYRRNTPEHIVQALSAAKAKGLFPLFPFGADFDATEEKLVKALRWLKSNTQQTLSRLGTILSALGASPSSAEQTCLARMGFDQPRNLHERLYARLITLALRRSAE
ncbi:MAG: acetyl-CoA hydrolase [Rhodanobacteraceae bacterium]|nr:acetyl-CoA hydrolase [Rhodanobacteraceae bacterium]